MSYFRHHAIIVTSANDGDLYRAFSIARELGLAIIGPSKGENNGYKTFLVCPDGSKENWPISKEGDKKRAMFKQALRALELSVHWVEIRYGYEDFPPEITDFDEKEGGPDGKV